MNNEVFPEYLPPLKQNLRSLSMANDFLPGNNNEASELLLNVKLFFFVSQKKQKSQLGSSKTELEL